MLKEAGAKEVHMRIASSCYYGVDILSNKMSVEEIIDFIGTDSLVFWSGNYAIGTDSL